jgi:hypothetical protein
MMKKGYWIAAIACHAMAAPLQAQALWDNTRFGMTFDELRNAQPEGEAYDDKDALYSGARCDLRIAEKLFGGHRYQACFYILEGQLLQVTLKAVGTPNLAQFNAAVAEARQQHADVVTGSNAISYWADWGDPKGEHGNVVFYNTATPFINVNYQYGVAPKPGENPFVR